MLAVLSGQILNLYENYLNLYEFEKMTDDDLENVEKVCNIFIEAIHEFADQTLTTCEDLRKYIIRRREDIGVPLTPNEVMLLTFATEQTDTYIHDVEDMILPDTLEPVFMEEDLNG